MDAMEVSASNLEALTTQYRAIAQNMANVNTVGYKRHVSQFQAMINQMDSSAHALESAGTGDTGGKVDNRIAVDFLQGSVLMTERPLDVALEGEGFLVVETADGPLYTRNGTLRTDSTGKLVDRQGRTVQGSNGPITIPPNVGESQINIGKDGSVSANGENLGRIRVVKFEDNSVLTPVGGQCYRAPEDAEVTDATETRFHQGCQERSNVSAVEELVNLIRVSRLYETTVKSVNQQDERMRKLLQVAQG